MRRMQNLGSASFSFRCTRESVANPFSRCRPPRTSRQAAAYPMTNAPIEGDPKALADLGLRILPKVD